jgi:hypothetical protein
MQVRDETTLEKSGEDVQLHLTKIGKRSNHTRNGCGRYLLSVVQYILGPAKGRGDARGKVSNGGVRATYRLITPVLVE